MPLRLLSALLGKPTNLVTIWQEDTLVFVEIITRNVAGMITLIKKK